MRVVLVLVELDLPFAVKMVDRAAGAQHQPEFRAINPAGMVPVIVDAAGPRDAGGRPVPIAQSGAILIYLAEKAGRLLPQAGAQRAAAIQWLMHVLADVNATISAIFHLRRIGSAAAGAAALGMFEKRLHTYLHDCCRPLQRHDYLAGEMSLADFALYPLVAAQEPFIRARRDLAPLLDWQQRMAQRPSVARGMRMLQ